MKSMKKLFFVLTIITLFFAITAVTAADNTDNAVITDTPTMTADADSSVISQDATTSTCENVITDTRNEILKDDKQIKSATNTTEVNNYDELTSTINSAVQDDENTEYIINLNPGTYQFTRSTVLNTGENKPTIIINGNNQTLTASNANRYLRFNNGCDVTIDNVTINHILQNYGNNITITNSIINGKIVNNKELNLIIKNSTINASVTNNGTLTIDDNCVLGESFELTNEGTLLTNKTELLLETMEVLEGNVTYENVTFKSLKTINGNVTLKNCTLIATYKLYGATMYNVIENNGSLNLINCNLICGFNNTGEMKIDNCTIPLGRLNQYGKLVFENIDWIFEGSLYQNIFLYGDTIFNNSKYSANIDQYVRIYTNGNVTFDNCQFDNIPLWVLDSVIDDSTLSVINSIFNNVTYPNIFNVENINLINSTFEDNKGRIVNSTKNAYIENCTFNNNSHTNSLYEENIYANNIGIYNSTFKNTLLSSSLMIIDGDCNIVNTTFENLTCNADSIYQTDNGIAINLQPTGGNKIINIEDNVFKNNYLNAVEGIIYTQNVWQVGLVTYDSTRNGFGTDISCGVDRESNNYTGSNNNISIINNQFINSETTQKAGSIFINFNETFENNSLTIKNNTFDNIKSKSETIMYNNTQNIDIVANSFINCTIDLDEFTLSSPQDTLTISPDTPITLNIQSILTNPGFYDSDLLNKNGYQIFINDENVYNTTENEFTFNSDTYGTLTIYVVNPAINNRTNEITITVIKKEIVITPSTVKVGDKINITAEIKINDELQSELNSGKVALKVNGKTLKDTNGKVIYAKVVNGKATIENYTVPESWNKNNITITAVYSGSSQLEKFTSQTEINIAQSVPTITTENITATKGDTITLKATITDGDKIINNGKVVFKVNGKTVKDANGKVIYTKVTNNQVNVAYLIPDSYKTGTYTITAVFISNDYDRLEDNKTLSIA